MMILPAFSRARPLPSTQQARSARCRRSTGRRAASARRRHALLIAEDATSRIIRIASGRSQRRRPSLHRHHAAAWAPHDRSMGTPSISSCCRRAPSHTLTRSSTAVSLLPRPTPQICSGSLQRSSTWMSQQTTPQGTSAAAPLPCSPPLERARRRLRTRTPPQLRATPAVPALGSTSPCARCSPTIRRTRTKETSLVGLAGSSSQRVAARVPLHRMPRRSSHGSRRRPSADRSTHPSAPRVASRSGGTGLSRLPTPAWSRCHRRAGPIACRRPLSSRRSSSGRTSSFARSGRPRHQARAPARREVPS